MKRASVMEPSTGESAAHAFTFGRFRLIPAQQPPIRDAVPIQLGSGRHRTLLVGYRVNLDGVGISKLPTANIAAVLRKGRLPQPSSTMSRRSKERTAYDEVGIRCTRPRDNGV
jgi:hypothetical protein